MARALLLATHAGIVAAGSPCACDRTRCRPPAYPLHSLAAPCPSRSYSSPWPKRREESRPRSSCTAFRSCCRKRVHARPAGPALLWPRKIPQPVRAGSAVNAVAILSAEPQSTAPFTNFQIYARINHKSPGRHHAHGSFSNFSRGSKEKRAARFFRLRLLFAFTSIKSIAQINREILLPPRRILPLRVARLGVFSVCSAWNCWTYSSQSCT